MQKILVMFFFLLVATFLSSCSGREDRLEYQVEQLTIENAKLQKSYDDIVALVKSDQDLRKANERSAGIAAGCDWLVSLCPISLVEKGRSTIQSGYTPNLFYFWINVLIKVILVGVFIAVVFITTALLYQKVIQPNQTMEKQTISSILSADEDLMLQSHNLEAEIWEYENTLENLMQVVAEKNALILQLTKTEEKLTEGVENLTRRHAFLEGEVERLQALYVVLKVLD